MTNYVIYLKPHKTLTIKGNTYDSVEIEVPEVDQIVTDGVFVRFQRARFSQFNCFEGYEDIIVYNRDQILGWEKVNENVKKESETETSDS